MFMHLTHELLPAPVQSPQKRRFRPVPLIKREPLEIDAVLTRPIVKLQADLRFRPVDHLVRNAGFPTAIAIVRPIFRQEEVAVEQAVEVARGLAQVHGHDAVLLLPHRPAMLPLNSRRLLPLLDETRLIEDPHRMPAGVIPHHDLGHAVTHPIVVPLVLAEKLLQGPHGHARLQCHRLHTLARQVRQLPFHLLRQMRPGIPPRNTVLKLVQITGQLRFQTTNLFGIHLLSSVTCRKANRFVISPNSRNTNLAL